jgi:hypothetical protein
MRCEELFGTGIESRAFQFPNQKRRRRLLIIAGGVGRK